jgi:hypothetical protein
MPEAGMPAMELPEGLSAEYANVVRISHSPMEIVLDFAQFLPGFKSKVFSRIIMSPLGAKLLLRALAENLTKYETAYGEIHIPGDTSLADFLFRSPQPPKSG